MNPLCAFESRFELTSPEGLPVSGTWLTKEPKTLKGGMQAVGNQHSEIRIALASAPNIVAKTPKEAARAVRCDQHGMLNTSFGISTSSENEKIWSAS
jgi:hypothetical protein